ncbi:hypothetical protein [Winogradskyella bathintestinalis]|uniref:Uncharacterized protein n=1 Tax=Winogradskyella bathintestinalis TaxID=3035208 RepID=A0ABT7ZV00_9FLAO|nr:hypothetical protein [Winogradskyella bathintestinalis]MDN3492830.1 hypothetical protein [Winogradskyella bathintestinalis]
MNIVSAHTIETQRRLFIEKDIREVRTWIDNLEYYNTELEDFKIVEKQLIRNSTIATNILMIRRKNILNMAALCKYEQALKVEYEYGKVDYNANRAKVHETKRANYLKFLEEYILLNKQFFNSLKNLQRKF